MFKWIEVWLGILIATDDELLEIRDPDDAKQLFKEIRAETTKMIFIESYEKAINDYGIKIIFVTLKKYGSVFFIWY